MPGIIKPPVGAQLKLDHPLARGLIGAWLLNEGSGDKAHDYSGQGNLGTLTNMDPATDWVGSPDGGALDFDGSDDVVIIPHKDILNLSAPFSIVFGIKYTSMDNKVFFEKNGNEGFSVQIYVGIIHINVGGDRIDYNATQSASLWNNGVFHQVVLVVPEVVTHATKLYVDGKDDTSPTYHNASTPTYGSNTPVYIGSRNGSYVIPGSSNFISIYNRALSAQEIAWLYAFPYAMFEEESPYWIPFKAAGGNTYNEAVTFSSAPACSHSPQADLLGSVAFASSPALSPAAIADLLGSIGLASTPALSPAGIADLLGAVTILSNPAVSMAHVLDIFPSIILTSNPAFTASALADFYSSLTLASTPAAVMAAVADLIASLALASDPAFAVVGGSDFYESLALSSSPALSSTVFKAAFGELALASSPALAAAATASLYAAITMATSAGISMTALADFFAALTLSSIPHLSALGQIGGEVIQKMVMESIGVREKLLRTKKQEADGDIDIRNLILTNPYDEIAPVSTTWERTEKIQKDVQ